MNPSTGRLQLTQANMALLEDVEQGPEYFVGAQSREPSLVLNRQVRVYRELSPFRVAVKEETSFRVFS